MEIFFEKEKIAVLKWPEKLMVGPPGFEPESIEPKSTSLDQASRWPHRVAVNIISQEP